MNIRKVISTFIAVLLIVSFFPISSMNWANAANDGMIRVKITNLGSNSSVTFKTSGSYNVNGKTIASGTSVNVSLKSGTLTLKSGSTTLATGSSITVNRNSGGTSCGVTFTSPSLANLYCGDLIFTASGSSIQTVVRIFIETYLYGVVPFEMSNSFPVEALKAQAVSARTYAMRAKTSSGTYDVTDNTTSQVFRGYSSSYGKAINAVNQTKGVCLMSGSSYAQCYYTASNGGQTEAAKNAWGGSISYLIVKDDPYDLENTASIVKSATIHKDGDNLNSSIASALLSAASAQLSSAGLSGAKVSQINAVTPHTPRYDDPSRTYTKLRFNVTFSGKKSSGNGTVTLDVDLATYGSLEGMLSLSINSGNNEIVSVTESDNAFTLSFRRFGHGVGLSQRGAQCMAANHGMGYSQILDFYYPGTTQKQHGFSDIISSFTPVSPTATPAPTETEYGYTTLQQGDSGEAVKALQTKLLELGFFSGTPLGNYQSLTTAAVKAFQAKNGLTADGVASPYVQKLIFEADSLAPVTPTATPSPIERTDATVKLSSATSRLNIRKAPSTSSAIAGTLAHGAKVVVTGISGEWSAIESGGITGYVMSTYLVTDSAPTTPVPSETPAPETPAYTTLKYGSTGDAVKALQAKLKELGYFTGSIGGNYLELTETAVKAFQSAYNLTADGVATPALQEKIFAATATAPEPTTAPSDEKSAVVKLSNSSSRLNVRKNASTSAAIAGVLSHGDSVTVTGVSGEWSAIQKGSLSGYVMTKYLSSGAAAPEPTTAPSDEKSAVVKLSNSSSRLNVRKNASTSAAIAGALSHGDSVTVTGVSGEWSAVQKGSLSGYVMTKYLAIGAAAPEQTPKPAATDTPSATAKPDSGEDYSTLKYGDTGEKVKALQRKLKELGYFDGNIGGNYLTLTETAVKAFQSANGLTADGVATADVQKKIFAATASLPDDGTANATVSISSSSYLNMRASASTSSKVLAKLKAGTRVRIVDTQGDWYEIAYGELEGFVTKSYIRKD